MAARHAWRRKAVGTHGRKAYMAARHALLQGTQDTRSGEAAELCFLARSLLSAFLACPPAYATAHSAPVNVDNTSSQTNHVTLTQLLTL